MLSVIRHAGAVALPLRESPGFVAVDLSYAWQGTTGKSPGRLCHCLALQRRRLRALLQVYGARSVCWRDGRGLTGSLPAPREIVEATTGFEPVNGGFADPCLTTWLRRRRYRF